MNIITKNEAETYLQSLPGDHMPSGGVPDDIIADMCRRMARFCGRDDWGPAQERTEYHDGGSKVLGVRVWPVVSVSRIDDDTDQTWSDGSKLDKDDYIVSADLDGVVYFHAATAEGYQNVRIIYTGGYANEAAVPQEIKRAALIQILDDCDKWIAGRLPTANGEMQLGDRAFGLLDYVQGLLLPWKRGAICA